MPVGGVEEPPCVIDGTAGIPLVRLFSSPGKSIGCWRVNGLKFIKCQAVLVFSQVFYPSKNLSWETLFPDQVPKNLMIPLKNCVSFSKCYVDC